MSSAICVTPTYCLFVCESRGVLPQPSISVSPGGVIPVGGNVTIWCWHQHLGLTFLLYKDEDRNYLAHTDTAGSEAEFPITSARREHGGNYTCRYHDKSGIYSEASDPVQIIVGSDPKPSISVSPGGVIPMGGNVTIQCWHQLLDMRILLYKAGDGNYLNYTDPAGSEAEFPITSARREHGEVAYSEPSDPMQIIVASEGPSPTPSQAPGGLSESWNPAEGTFSRERRGLGALLPGQRQLLISPSELSSDSSLPPTAAPPGHLDFTHANIARLVLSAVVLLVLGLILAEAYYSCPREVPYVR
uniref:Ig-like domain-containing protein n=1 Tax=Chrysemys picta bellii TaxID=8478 RepID=A0A8C3HSG6_CHRPI